MKNLGRWLLAFLFGAGSVALAGTSYRRLYVFGDSYSDIGAGYVDGNGPTAVAYLAWQMGLTLTHPRAADPDDQSLDFAVSGAQTGEGSGRKLKDALLGYGMMNQVNDFAAAVKSGQIRFHPAATLFFIAGGLNDGQLSTAETISHLRRELEILAGLGGKHFTVALLPTKIPGFAAVGQRLNPALERLVHESRERLKIDIWTNHWGAYFDQILDHPADYGIVNTTDACAGRAIFDQDTVPVGDPSTYFYYHAEHPSTAVHRMVGRKLADELKGHPAG